MVEAGLPGNVSSYNTYNTYTAFHINDWCGNNKILFRQTELM